MWFSVFNVLVFSILLHLMARLIGCRFKGVPSGRWQARQLNAQMGGGPNDCSIGNRGSDPFLSEMSDDRSSGGTMTWQLLPEAIGQRLRKIATCGHCWVQVSSNAFDLFSTLGRGISAGAAVPWRGHHHLA